MEISAKFKDIIEKIEAMSVLELSDLVKVLEEKFGVSAQAPTLAVGVPAAGGAAAEEKSSFNIELKEAGAQKIQVIKVLREALGLGLKEAKDMTDKAPIMVKEGVDKKTADELKAKLEAAGGVVVLK